MTSEQVTKILKTVKEAFLNIFFPKRCVYCGKILGYKSNLSICAQCAEKCMTREKPLRDFETKYFDSVLCASYYERHMKNAILNFKFHGVTYLAPTFAHILLLKLKEDFRFAYADIITCVPLGRARLAKRGYNQSELVAREASKSLSGEFISNLLFKVKDVPPLSKMTAAKRRRAVKNAYKFNNNFDIRGKTVLLIDDIFTTGATVNECARILKLNGAKSVFAMCVCETRQKGLFENDLHKENFDERKNLYNSDKRRV